MKANSERVFKGTVDSASDAFSGMRVPATLRLIDQGNTYECHFTFDVGFPVPFLLVVPKSARIEGTAKDPRGWDVSFAAELVGNRVTGTFRQPHDHGTFDLVTTD